LRRPDYQQNSQLILSDYVDSCGLAELISCQRRALESRVEIKLLSPSAKVHALFQVTGLDQILETFRLVGAEVTLIHDRLEESLELRLPDVVLNDIGRVGSGETASSAAKQIIGPVLTQTLNAAKERAREELEQIVRDEIEERKQEAVESLKDKLLGDR
jgi:hypothetical protein